MADQVERQVGVFDRALGMLDGLNGVTRTAPTTKVVTVPIIGQAATYIVQTFRRRDENDEAARSEDTIFLQYLDGTQSYRIVIPSAVADVIARQRDSLGTQSRKRAGRALAERRRADGTAVASHLNDPKVRAKALKARRAKAEARRARREVRTK